MEKSVFVSGGSGFAGQAVIDELLRRQYTVRAIFHRRALPQGDGLIAITGDLFNPAAMDEAMRGCVAAINLVGIIFEKPSQGVTFQRIHVDGTRAFVDAARRNGIGRIVQLSALGSRANAVSEYHKTKFAAEEIVRGSGISWTIFRPSIIHGPRGDFMRQVAGWAHRRAAPWIFMPYFGGGLFGTKGAGKLQPVFVGDVARAIVDAIDNPKTIGQTYAMGGPDIYSWPQMLHLCARAITGRDRLVCAIPVWYAKLLPHLVPASLLPFNRDQISMVSEDSTADMTPFERDFGWTPRTMSGSLDDYAASL